MDVSTTSALVTWQFSQPGGRTVAVRYTDNDGQTGGIYEFQVIISQTRRYYYIKDHPPVVGQALGSIRTTVDKDGMWLVTMHIGVFNDTGVKSTRRLSDIP